MEQKLFDAAAKLPKTDLSFEDIRATTPLPGKTRRSVASLAACIALLVCVCFGLYACAEIEEYNDAVEFFDEYDLSTEGLTRGEIKAVYRDIITESFTYTKTAEVIEKSQSRIPGYEILQKNTLPDPSTPIGDSDGRIWVNSAIHSDTVRYAIRNASIRHSYIEKYNQDQLDWQIMVDCAYPGCSVVSDGIIVFGTSLTYYGKQPYNAWIAKYDTDGNRLWMRELDHGFDKEEVAFVFENADGSYGVISRGFYDHLCVSQYSADGTELFYKVTEVGNYGIWNAARLGDGYLVQLGSYVNNEHAKIVKIDAQGNITDSYSYGEEDAYYFITDMIEFDGKVYLSAYAVPKPEDESRDAGGRHDIAVVLNYLDDNDIWEIPSEELTPIVRENNTAILLVCDPDSGEPEEFYSVEGSIGSKLAISETGTLLWDVESITDTYYSPYTSAYTIGGSCQIYRYSFSDTGTLIRQEKTGETTGYYR